MGGMQMTRAPDSRHPEHSSRRHNAHAVIEADPL